MRIRTIKPEFWTDKRVATWDHFTRLFYVGLWSAADDKGRGSAEPARLAAGILPYDLARNPLECLANVSKAIQTLVSESRITLYAVGDEDYFQINNWARHQKIDHPTKSRIPALFENDSREIREHFASISRSDQGSGIREQGSREEEKEAPLPPEGEHSSDFEPDSGKSDTFTESPSASSQKKERGGRASGELELPEGMSQARRETLLTWLRYKAERRQHYKPTGFAALVAKVEPLTDQQLAAAVQLSMENSWAGLFPEKVTAQGGIQERKKEAPHRPAQAVVGAARTDEPTDAAAWRYILAQGYPDMQSAAATVPWSALPEDTREWVKSQMTL